ncbi:PIG-L deacetylase family protein [Streptomyces sp. NPDC059785]|uniref:PIG-L deacetylase family protein n=1 Tax=unclassified Streptomyces TaxID=2593676 RepID=UPI0036683AB7
MTPVAIAFTAHPDDAEIAMGGTLATLVAAGWEVHVVVSSVPNHRDRRLAEVDAGAAVLGTKAHVLEHPGTWQVEDLPTYALVRRFDAFVKELEPDRVFTHWSGDTHHDHALVARATVSALRNSSADLYMAEQSNQYAPSLTAFPVNTYVDVSRHFRQKLQAVACHASQTAGPTYEHHLRSRGQYHGERIGCDFAEAFSCVIQRLESR